MKVFELTEKLELTPLVRGNSEAEIQGCYIGDLLSLVMSRAQEGEVWLTVQTNVNIIAVAVLTEISCIIVTEGMDIPEETIAKAAEQGIPLFQSAQTSYELACALSKLL